MIVHRGFTKGLPTTVSYDCFSIAAKVQCDSSVLDRSLGLPSALPMSFTELVLL